MTLLSQGHSEARRLIAGIRHPVLDEAGVVEAVAHLINEQNREKGPKIEFRSLVDFSRLVPLLENAIYRIIQEGMTNACKYSKSKGCGSSFFSRRTVCGLKFEIGELASTRKRCRRDISVWQAFGSGPRLLGGKCRIRSKPKQGTSVVVELPVVEKEEET